MHSILRNPWPYAITAWFAACIIGVVAWVSFSMRQRTDLVGADYYEQEINYQQQIERLKRTQPLSAQMTIDYDATKDAITITLPTAHAGRSAAGSIHLYRPSDAKLDHRFPLATDANGSQLLDARKLRPGLWKVRVQWTADGQEYFVDQSVVVGPHRS